MTGKRVMLIGEKETFLIRALVKKSQSAGVESVYVPFAINDINSNWENTGLITMYMDDGCRPPEDVLHFLNDKMGETGMQMIIIGEKPDVQYVVDNTPNDLIYKTFARPLNNEEYIETVNELFAMIDAGEFKKSILIVDDDPNYLGLVREWLKGKFKVSMANSGLQAIKWLGKNKADLILLDHEMPITTGPQVLEMLRSDEETKDIPVIFLTGKGDKESVMEVVALKPEGYFLKTIERHELIKQLEDFFVKHP